jgi:xenotropic and polytropic retrovirus receptor 1
MWMNFSIEDEESLLHVHFPTILYGISLLLMFLPIRAIYHKSRLWWAYSNVRIAVILPVEGRASDLPTSGDFSFPASTG